MSDDIAISVEHVTKTFKLPHEKQSSIKGALINKLKGGRRAYERQQVLHDVSFEIKKGEFFGIVGRNGSGKSTLLKMLAGIYTPSKGNIEVNGKLTPFIELGVGFNPELTGRENVFLNGALLGFNRTEMAEMYDEIVTFAELERFMDQKLKNYSSGMQVRLAFSIAIQAKSDILVLDEVLAVGDEAFQRKCIDVFEDYKAKKQTIILVTHDMETVRKFCSRAMLISDGVIIFDGDPSQAASKYTKLNLKSINNDIEKKEANRKESNIHIETRTAGQQKAINFKTGDTMTVFASWPADIPAKYVGIAIMKKSGEYVFGSNTLKHSIPIEHGSVEFDVVLRIDPGKYYITASLSGSKPGDVLDILDLGPEFLVTKNANDYEGGMVRLDSIWRRSPSR